MAGGGPPSTGILSVLRSYEFVDHIDDGVVGLHGLYNVVLRNLEFEVTGFSANLVGGGFIALADYGRTAMTVPIYEVKDQRIFVQCSHTELLLEAYEVVALKIFVHPYQDKSARDILTMSLSKDGLLLPRLHEGQKLHVDLFSGGYGGWTAALKCLRPAMFADLRSVSIEHDRKIAFQHAVNYTENFFPYSNKLPTHLLQRVEGNLVICADINDVTWQQAIAGGISEVWTISPPCQPWTRAAYQQGTDDPRGLTMPQAFGLARIHKPRLILFENVRGFRTHDQYPIFGQMMSWAGYQIFHEAIVELADICPIRRPRYLAILIQRNVPWDGLPKWHSWKDFTFSTPLNFGCWTPQAPDDPEDYFPSEVTKAFYMNAELCPTKGAQPVSTHRVFQTRVPGLNVKQPVLMAKYGEQHLLDVNLLLEKGLHGFFCPDQMSYQWWKPMELALMHLQPHDLMLFRPRTHAWHILGNMIAVPHAVLLWVNAWNVLHPDQPPQDPHFLLTQMIANRRVFSKSQILYRPHAWILTSTEGKSDLEVTYDKIVEDLPPHQNAEFRWPDDTYWNQAFGLQPLSKLRKQEHIYDHDLRTESSPPPSSAKDDASKTDTEVSVVSPGAHESTSPPHDIIEPVAVHEAPEVEAPPQAKRLKQETSSSPEAANNATDPALSESQEPASTTGENTATLELALQEPRATVTPYLIPGEYGTLNIMGPVYPWQLLHLWDHDNILVCADTMQPFPDDQLLQGPLFSIPHTMIQHDPPPAIPFDELAPLLLQFDDRALFLMVPSDLQVCDFLANALPGVPNLFDHHGMIPHSHLVSNLWVVTTADLPMSTQMHIDLWLINTDPVIIEPRFPDDTDHLVCTFEGPLQSIENVLLVWYLVLSPDWQLYHGRKLCLQVDSDTKARLIFAANGKKFSTPAIYLIPEITMRICRNQLRAMEVEEGLQLLIKHEGRILFRGQMDPQRKVATLLQMLRQAFWPQYHGRDMILLCQARSVGDEVRLYELREPTSTAMTTPVVLHLRAPQLGGVQSGSKKEHHHLLHTKLAELFHQSGILVHQTPGLVEQFLRQYGTSRVTHLLFGQQNAQKWTDFRKLCQEAHIDLPSIDPHSRQQQGKYQKLAKYAQAKARNEPDAAAFQLRQGFFLYQDDNPAKILTSITPWARGVCMLDFEQAAPWLRELQSQSPDELAIFIVGPEEIDTALPWIKVSAPALNNQGQEVILQGVLLQLGEKAMKLVTNGANVKLTSTKICSFTLWKDEFPPEQWQAILQAPVKEAKSILPPELAAQIKNPWGRSFRTKRQQVAPDQAESVQFHVEVKSEAIIDLLRPSGFNRLHIVPKDEHGHPSPEYSIIWTDGDALTIQTKAGRLPGQAGFVRGKKRHGIRFENSAYANAWQKLRPGDDMPMQGSYPLTFRLEPLPFGVDAGVLRKWAEEIKWDIKPLKNQGPKRWLVAAATPPESYLAFNGQVLLVTKLDRKAHAHRAPALIGPQGNREVWDSKHEAPAADQVDPLQIKDPWQNFRSQTTRSTTTASTEQSQHPRPFRMDDTGPVAQTLTRQDHRLQQLEQSVQEIKAAQQQATQQTDIRFQQLESNLTSYQTTTTQALGDFRTSLQEAVTSQQAQLQDTLLQVKQLFLRGQKRTARSPDSSDQEQSHPDAEM